MDEELSDKNVQLAMELEQKKQMQKAAKEQFLYKLGNKKLAPIVTDEEIENLLACIRNPEAQMCSNFPVPSLLCRRSKECMTSPFGRWTLCDVTVVAMKTIVIIIRF